MLLHRNSLTQHTEIHYTLYFLANIITTRECKQLNIYSALYISSLSLKRSDMARV